MINKQPERAEREIMYKISTSILSIAGLRELLQEACDNGVAGTFELSDAGKGETKIVFERELSEDAKYIEARTAQGFKPKFAACFQLATEIEELGSEKLLPLVRELKHSDNWAVTDLNFTSVSKAAATNKDRAGWAQVAADAFASETRMDKANEDMETVLTDLLCDIMHLCNQKGIDFKQVLDSGQAHFETDLVEEADDLEDAKKATPAMA